MFYYLKYIFLIGFVYKYRYNIYQYTCILYTKLFNNNSAFKTNNVKVTGIVLYTKHPSITIVDNIDNLGCKIHFENWLNYIFCIADQRPNSKSKIDWVESDLAIITYNYNNNVYKIGLSKDFNDNTKRCHLKAQGIRSRIISAHIIRFEPYKLNNVTSELQHFMGPNYDLYKFNDDDKDTTTNIKCILQDYTIKEWDELAITNSFGEVQLINLKVNKYIDIDNNSLFRL